MNKKLFKKWCCQYRRNYKFLNILTFPVNFFKYLKERRSFLKKGYPYEAIYSMDSYFVELFTSILREYKEVHNGTPVRFTNEQWENIIQEMIDCLEKMEDVDNEAVYEQSKKRFFILFSKYFTDLWD